MVETIGYTLEEIDTAFSGPSRGPSDVAYTLEQNPGEVEGQDTKDIKA
jgi:hypothetical protein